MYRHFLHVMWLTLCLTLCPWHAKGEWLEFLSLTGQCKVNFPELPEHARKDIPLQDGKNMYYDIYASGFGKEALYLLIVAQFPVALNPEQEQTSLEGFLNGILQNDNGNKLLQSQLTEFQGHKALDFVIQSNNLMLHGRAIVVGSKLYLLALQGNLAKIGKTNLEKFIKSFELVKGLP